MPHGTSQCAKADGAPNRQSAIAKPRIFRIRITSYNVCYTKLLRDAVTGKYLREMPEHGQVPFWVYGVTQQGGD